MDTFLVFLAKGGGGRWKIVAGLLSVYEELFEMVACILSVSLSKI